MKDFEDVCDEKCQELFEKKVENGEVTYEDLNDEIKMKLFLLAEEDYSSQETYYPEDELEKTFGTYWNSIGGKENVDTDKNT